MQRIPVRRKQTAATSPRQQLVLTGPPLTLSSRQAAQVSGLSEDVIRDAIASGQLAIIRIGRNMRIRTAELERFVAAAQTEKMDLAELRPARANRWPSRRAIAPGPQQQS